MTYKIRLTKRAEKNLAKVSGKAYKLIAEHISALAEDPHPAGSIPLTGEKNIYRLRVGQYRILYEIHEQIITIIVLDIDVRGNIYKKRS